MVDHLCQEASCVGASAESEEEQVVFNGVVSHEELVATHDVVGEGRTYSLVLHLGDPVLHPVSSAGGLHGSGGDISADARLIVSEGVWVATI